MITVVTGPPCSGKSTYVDDHRSDAAVALDFDRLAHALGYPDLHVDWSCDQHDAQLLLANHLWTQAMAWAQAHRDVEIWVISTSLSRWQRRKWEEVGARFVYLAVDQATCEARALAAMHSTTRSGRSTSTLDEIARFFESPAGTQTDSATSPPQGSDKTGRP